MRHDAPDVENVSGSTDEVIIPKTEASRRWHPAADDTGLAIGCGCNVDTRTAIRLPRWAAEDKLGRQPCREVHVEVPA